MEIFITLTKYNTQQRRAEGNHCWCVQLNQHIFMPLTIMSNVFLKNGTYPFIHIGRVYKNTEKSPGDLMRLFVTQTPVKDHQLTLVWKTLKGVIIIMIIIITHLPKYMKVTVLTTVIGPLGIVTRGLVKELEDSEIRGRMRTFQAVALLRSDRILRRVLRTWEDLLSLRLQWEAISLRWCQKLSKE